MAYVERRVFYGKVGMGAPLIEHLRKFGELAERYGIRMDSRILSDFNSGRTDRIVWETRVEDIRELLEGAEVLNSPEAAESFSTWNGKLNELIHYAEVEFWQLHA